MKSLITVILQFVEDRPRRTDVLSLLRFILFIAILVGIYSVIFHYIMEYEGRSESWVTGIYWTLTVMSTLGFGDITFTSDIGKLFSVIVLMSGIIFLLVLLPFTFIEFFYAPWMKAQEAARAPRELPEHTNHHIILTHFDAVTEALIEQLQQYHHSYVLLVPDIDETLKLHDLGYRVMYGDLDDPKTYEQARVQNALFLASTASDQVNVNVAFTVSGISENIPIIATANATASVDILELAGCNHVLQLGEIVGRALARQIADGATTAHMIGEFDDLIIAEAAVRGTSLVNKTLADSALRANIGITILGAWERGNFKSATPEMGITEDTILLMAGSRAHIHNYNEAFRRQNVVSSSVIIIGGGRVGRAVGDALSARGLDYRIVEKKPERIRDPEKYILGDAAELEVLEQAGIRESGAVVVTTHDDDMNVYMTIYCRRLRPDAQIISRANLERNVATLHRAGADFVLSYASISANAIINLIGRENILMVAEGLNIFEVDMPDDLVGKTIAESDIRKKTGCSIVALKDGDDAQLMPNPHQPLPANARLIIIGMEESEERFLKLYQ